jgi:hypothetical protein
MIDLLKIEPTEAERIAYTEGFTMAAELFARIADLEGRLLQITRENEILRDQLADLELRAFIE